MQATQTAMDDRARNDLTYWLNRLDGQIQVELELIGQRMNVLAVSQAFLFTAFTTDMLVSDAKLIRLRSILLYMIPILGIVVCTIIGLSLGAAITVIRCRKREREICRDKLRAEFEKTLLKPGPLKTEILEHVTAGSWPDRFGNYPAAWLALAIGVCWIVLLIALFI